MTTHAIVMGVSGCGKSTVAMGLARELDWELGEADAFHPQANIDKMHAGNPLTDEDRWPWLRTLAEWIRERDAAGISTVLACSALKVAYRDILRTGAPRVSFIHLAGPQALVAERVAAKKARDFARADAIREQLRARGIVVEDTRDGSVWRREG